MVLTEKSKDKELELIRKNSPYPNISAINTSNYIFNKEKKPEIEEEHMRSLIEIDSNIINSLNQEDFKRNESNEINLNKSETEFEYKNNNLNQQNSHYIVLENDTINLLKKNSNDSHGLFTLGNQTNIESISDHNEFYLVEKILNFVETRKPLNHLLCGYFSKIFDNLCKLKISQVIINHQ